MSLLHVDDVPVVVTLVRWVGHFSNLNMTISCICRWEYGGLKNIP